MHELGIVTAGAGEHLQAAREPALVDIRTEQGDVTFAFLGYDIIAPWYHAEEDQPGTAPLVAEFVRRDISAASKLADHVLVGANWGVEYVADPVAYQRDLAAVAMEAGATFLFGKPPPLGPGDRTVRRPARGVLVRQLCLRSELADRDNAGDVDGVGIHQGPATGIQDPSGRDSRALGSVALVLSA